MNQKIKTFNTIQSLAESITNEFKFAVNNAAYIKFC